MKKILLFLGALIGLSFWPNSVALAQANTQITPDQLPGSTLKAEELIPTIIGLFLTIIAVVAFVSLIYSGFMYITAAGDAAKAEKARKNIVWALTGIVIAIVAYVLVRTVAGLFS